MGNKVSAVHGVRSPNFYEPGNAVNEIWVGDLEVVSRLPFGDSDMAQAAWPKNDYPKIPWRPFIIPLRAAFDRVIKSRSLPSITSPESGWMPALRDFADTKLSLICWVAMQILAFPLLMIPIALHLAPLDTGTADDEFLPSPIQLDDGDDAEMEIWIIPPQQNEETVYSRAFLASVLFVMGTFLLYGFDHGLDLNPSPSDAPLESMFSSRGLFGSDISTIYTALSAALVFNSAYSVARLWWVYFASGSNTEELEATEKDVLVIPKTLDATEEEVANLLF
ncbi:hypothetical protein FQN50_003850 [Emmonsiellopsis sp. PD_5]|nr:hypothetical protein FQN50_003850 [Emmonsiellopsis sp. PD_5]